eukprot:585083-Prorocentrum_lima.AAC.1
MMCWWGTDAVDRYSWVWVQSVCDVVGVFFVDVESLRLCSVAGRGCCVFVAQLGVGVRNVGMGIRWGTNVGIES